MGINPTKIIKNMVVEATKDTKELFDQINVKISDIDSKVERIERKVNEIGQYIKILNNEHEEQEEDELLKNFG